MKKILQQWAAASAILICFSTAANAQETEQPDTTKPRKVQITAEDVTIENPFLRRLVYPPDSATRNKRGFTIRPGITFGVGYRIRRTRGDKEPFGQEHSLIAYYNFDRGAFFIEYRSLFNEALGKWNLGLVARTYHPNVNNFFGIGNETPDTTDIRFYRLRSNELFGGISINRLIDSVHFLELAPFYQLVNIKQDTDRIASKDGIGITKEELTQENFAGIAATYQYLNVNNVLIPTKGVNLGAGATYTLNTLHTSRQFMRYTAYTSFYFPLSRAFTLAFRVGGATNQGESDFFQLNTMGGNENLRGYRRQRYYGKSSFYNNNELRWLTRTNRALFRQVGLIAFFDNGRVWYPGEDSGTWHTGYGGGLIIVPFNRAVLNGSVGFSEQGMRIHARVGYLF